MRTMNHPNARAIILDSCGYNALAQTEAILREVQLALGGETVITSLETGEVITPGELARARVILDFIHDYRMVEVN